MTNALQAPAQGTAAQLLQIPDETQLVADFELDTSAIEAAKTRFCNVDATTRDGYKEAILGRAMFRDTRTGIETKRKQLKEASLEYGRRVDSVAKRLTALVEPFEKQIDAKIRAVDNAKAEEKRAQQEAQRRAQEEMERKQREEEERRIAEKRAELAREREQFEAEQRERREQEERERQAREEAERKRLAEYAARNALIARLHATGLPGCSCDETCVTTDGLTLMLKPEFASMPLLQLESLVASKELIAKNQREARERIEQQQREQREAEERKAAEERAAEEQRLAQQRADIEAREAAIAAKEKAEREAAKEQARKEREQRALLEMRLQAVSLAHLEACDRLSLAELESLVLDQEAKFRRAEEEQAAREAEERAVAEAERQAALAKRIEALKPDCEKLRVYAESIRTVPVPEFSDDTEICATVNTAIDALMSLADSLDRCADMITSKGPEVVQ